MSLFGPFVYKNKKKEKFWLHMSQRGNRVIYYFSKNPEGALFSVPLGYEVVENPKTGMPFLRKKRGGFFNIFGFLKPKKKEEEIK